MTIERVSIASDGSQGDSYSEPPAISSDGRYVAFSSVSPNLVPGDTNNTYDIFLHDRETGETTRVSVASDGTEANNNSFNAAISGDGRYIAFTSYADNLVPWGSDREWKGMSSTIVNENGETQQVPIIIETFVHDRQTGETKQVNVASDGTLANNDSYIKVVSEDGRYVAFTSYADNLVPGDTNNRVDVFVRDLQTEETTRINVAAGGIEANGESSFPAISGDGRFVAFQSHADNLVAGDTNNTSDIFVHDRETGETTRVSVASDGTEGNSFSKEGPNLTISADGRYVAFQSDATNLVPGDTNNKWDIFVHDRETGETTRVSVASDGTQANGWNYEPTISADGRYVVFSSNADNLALGDKDSDIDLFIHDRETKETKQISAGWNTKSDVWLRPSISADERYIAFNSVADNLVPGDTNNDADVFVYDRLAPSPDILDGKAGNDTIIGGPDNDILIGGGGKDTLNGGPGDDLYRLDAKTAKGSEIVDGGGSDILELENADIFSGGLAEGLTGFQRQGKNLIIDLNADGKADKKDDLTIKNFFAAGKDNKPGQGFIETVGVLSGQNIIATVDKYQPISTTGDNQKNTLKGNYGNDLLKGRGGNDKLVGNDGDDTLIGANGNDRLIGGPGADTLTGGKGNDRFIFDNITRSGIVSSGTEDIITDFGDRDKIVLDLDTFDRLDPKVDFAEQFAVVKGDRGAASKDALVIYNETNGNLFYNANGSIGGFGSGGLLANLADSPELDAKDFILRS